MTANAAHSVELRFGLDQSWSSHASIEKTLQGGPVLVTDLAECIFPDVFACLTRTLRVYRVPIGVIAANADSGQVGSFHSCDVTARTKCPAAPVESVTGVAVEPLECLSGGFKRREVWDVQRRMARSAARL